MYGSLNRLIVISALGGISTAAILTAINSGAQAADSGKVSLWPAALFIVALFLFIKTQHYILITATAEQFGTNLRATVSTMVPNLVRSSTILLNIAFIHFKGITDPATAALWLTSRAASNGAPGA